MQGLAQRFKVTQVRDAQGDSATRKQRKVIVELLKGPAIFLPFLKKILLHGGEMLLRRFNVLLREVLDGIWREPHQVWSFLATSVPVIKVLASRIKLR